MKEEARIKRRFELVAGELNERSRRLVAATTVLRTAKQEARCRTYITELPNV